MKRSFDGWAKHAGVSGRATGASAIYPKHQRGNGIPTPPKCQSSAKQHAGADWLGNGTLRHEFAEMSAAFAKQAAGRHPKGSANGVPAGYSQRRNKIWSKLQGPTQLPEVATHTTRCSENSEDIVK